MKIPSLIYYTYTLISAPKIHTNLLWDLTILFLGLGGLYFVSIFVIKSRISKKNRIIAEKKQELSPKISEFLFHEEDDPIVDKANYIDLKIEVREYIKDPANRKVFAEVLLDLRKDVSGDTLGKLCQLYRDFDLDKDAYKKLKSWRWEVVAKGILELTQMQVQDAYGFIVKFINDKRPTVRRQAEIAVVSLKPEGISYFLDTTRYKITEWQQLKLLDVIRNKEDFEAPKFRAWLTSKNKHVVLFALRLIKYYSQNDANASIIELVKHRDTNVKQEAIDCIKEFLIFDGLQTLQSVFWKCNVDTKISILDAMAHIGDTSEIAFLRLVENRETNFTVKSKAFSAINSIAPETIMPTDNIVQISDQDILSENDMEEFLQTTSADEITTEVEKETPIQHQEVLFEASDIVFEPKESSPELNFDNTAIKSTADLHDIETNAEVVREETNALLTEKIPQEHIINQPAFVDSFMDTNEKDGNNFMPMIDMDNENEEIFDICFMQELQDILSGLDALVEGATDQEYVPLDFLPIVSEGKSTTEEESFKKELNDILERMDEPEATEVEPIELNFLPLVKEQEQEQEQERELELNDEGRGIEGGLDIDLEVDILLEAMDVPTAKHSETSTDEVEDTPEDDTFLGSSPNVGFKGFSIFEELFRTCDDEAKLILLDEIVAVGDEKEIEFLNTLLNDSNSKISEKAALLKIELEQKLSVVPSSTETLESIGFSAERSDEEKELLKTIAEKNDKKKVKSLELCFLEDEVSPPDFMEITFDLDMGQGEEVKLEIPVQKGQDQEVSFFDSISALIKGTFHG